MPTSEQFVPRAHPCVSIVVPSFNERVGVLAESLGSLRAQTFSDFECIVVDESTDAEKAASCRRLCEDDSRFTYIHPSKRIGLPASLNLAIARARGRLIARFDSDDVCRPDRLAMQVDFMDRRPDIDVVGSALELIDDYSRSLSFRTYPLTHVAIERRMQTTTALAHPTVMFRADVVKRLGSYDPEYRYSEDLDLWLRWLNAGVRFANLPQPLVRYRQVQTRRGPLHWRCNLKARTSNFSSRHLLRRVAGIAAVGVWMVMPVSLQESLYRRLVLDLRRPGSDASEVV
jgi:glycosyltransferase involved in cell wall biosynthesis